MNKKKILLYAAVVLQFLLFFGIIPDKMLGFNWVWGVVALLWGYIIMEKKT